MIGGNGDRLESEGNCSVCGGNGYGLLNNLDGIRDVRISENGDYGWEILEWKGEGMEDVGLSIGNGRNVVM